MNGGATAGPDIAVDVSAKTIGDAVVEPAEFAAVGEGLAVHNVEHTDLARRASGVAGARVCDVERCLIRRKDEAVGLEEVRYDGG